MSHPVTVRVPLPARRAHASHSGGTVLLVSPSYIAAHCDESTSKVTTMSTTISELAYDSASDGEDEFDWEEVAVPEAQPLEPYSEDQPGPSTRPNIEVILEAHPAQGKEKTQYAVLLVLSERAC
jgi:hypothetical protein